MDAVLFGLKTSNLGSSTRSAKVSGKEEQPSKLRPAGVFTAHEKGAWEIGPQTQGHVGRVEVLACPHGFSLPGQGGRALTVSSWVFGCLWSGREAG